MPMSLLETTLRTVRDQLVALTSRDRIDLSLVHEPVLDPQELAHGPWSLSHDHPAQSLGDCRRHHSLGTFVYRQPVSVPQLADCQADDGRLRFAEPPFDAAGRLMLLNSRGKAVSLEIGALRDFALAWPFAGGQPASSVQDLISLAQYAGVVMGALKDKPPPGVSRDTLNVANPLFRWFCLLFDLAWAKIPGSPFPEPEKRLVLLPGLTSRELSPKKPTKPDESDGGADREALVERLRQRRVRRLLPLWDLEPESGVARPPILRPMWHADISDVLRASVYAIDVLLQPHVDHRADDGNYLSKKDIKDIFAMTDKRVDGFLSRHHAVRTLRPMTKAGKPHPRLLRIHLLDFASAIRHDDYYANNPQVQQRIQQNLKKAEINKKLLDACTELFIPGQLHRK
jgi:hypothetical protein